MANNLLSRLNEDEAMRDFYAKNLAERERKSLLAKAQARQANAAADLNLAEANKIQGEIVPFREQVAGRMLADAQTKMDRLNNRQDVLRYLDLEKQKINVPQKGLMERQKLENLNQQYLQEMKGEQAYKLAELQQKPEMAKLDFIKSQEPFRQYSVLQELGTNAASQGMPGPDTTGMGFRQYQKMFSDPVYASLEDSIRKKLSSGINPTKINWTEDELIHLRANMPGILPEKQTQDKVVFNPETQTYSNVPTRSNKQTFESIYGNKPTLRDIWAKDEELKNQREAARKSNWTVPY